MELNMQDDDYTIMACGPLYSQYCCQANHCDLGTFNTLDECLIAIHADMEASQFWPDIYFINDHGNTDLLSVEFQPDGDHSVDIVESWV
jgi:hypothetical protein